MCREIIQRLPIDGKYEVRLLKDSQNRLSMEVARSRGGGGVPADEPLFLFRARDKLAVASLRYYLTLCQNCNCAPKHIAGVDRRIGAFSTFAADSPDSMKEPGRSMRPPSATKTKEEPPS